MTLLAILQQRGRKFIGAQPIYWREAALCMPAIPLILIGTALTHDIAYGAVAGAAAFTVGFGAARDLRGWRWAAMIAATIGSALMAFIGVVSGQFEPALLAIAALAAASCAILALIDDDVWWISLQLVIALVVGGYYFGDVHAATLRAAAVLAGGTAQIVVVVILAKLFPNAAGRLPRGPRKEPAPRKLIISHGIRAAACVALSLAVARHFGLANAYWAPMTAMLVLRPGLSETRTRGMARLSGTLIGCVLATLFAMAVGYSQLWLIAGVTLTAWAAYTLQRAHYSLLTSFVTATVVLLLSLARGGALANAEHRIIATVLGGVIALLISAIAPHRPLAKKAKTGEVAAPAG